MRKEVSQKVALRGLLIATAFVLSWIEAQIPYSFVIPGIKLGLTNLVVLIALYKLSSIDAFFINVVRILLVSLTFGNMASFFYALAGGILSFIIMFMLKKYTKASTKIISVSGGIAHNIGQICVAILVLENVHIIWYLPYLWLSGTIAGFLIGLLCELVVKRLDSNIK